LQIERGTHHDESAASSDNQDVVSLNEPVRRAVEVPPELAGERVDKAAAELFDDFSRATLTGWITDGFLTVDGGQVKPKQRLRGGERLEIDAEFSAREDWASAQPVEFEVVYEDPDLLVIDKPAGLVVHPGAGNPDRTLVNGLLLKFPSLERLPRAGIVHRLDKDTSGLMVVAASPRAHTSLVRDLQARQIERRYLAIIEGRMVGGRDIDAPIGRDPRQRTRQRIREDGKPALTRVRVRERFRVHSLIEAELATGRTHQIRVHLASVGHPLVGDRRYGARGKLPPGAEEPVVERLRQFRRQALHAWQLIVPHPGSGERMEFASAMPDDMAVLVEILRRDASDSMARGDR
jgi:23S rRNA pseudouridine1911/1915/1917 synthase